MKNTGFLLFSITTLIFTLTFPWGCSSDKLPEPTLDVCDSLGLGLLTYDLDIKPIIDTKCASPGCHVVGFGSGNFTTFQGMESRLEDGSIRQRTIVLQDMPDSGSPALTDDEMQRLDCWLLAGHPEN